MDTHLSRYLAAIRLALPYARSGAAEVRTSSTAERTVIDVLSPEGIVATTTVYTRAQAPTAPPAQLALSLAPAALAPPAPLADDPIELVAIEGWEPMPQHEALDPQTCVLWTPESTEPDADDRWRTVVPASVAARLEALAPGCFERRPGLLSVPSHVVRVGEVMATSRGPMEVTGVARDSESGTGLVLGHGPAPLLAWTDSAAIEGDALSLFVSGKYIGIARGDGWWNAAHIDSARRAEPSKSTKTPTKKPAKAPAPMVSRWVLEADWQALPEGQRAQLFAGANHLPAGSLYRELGPMPVPVAIDLDADAAGVVTLHKTRPAADELAEAAQPLIMRAQEHAAATARAPKKSAPGSKKKPHRMTPIPEADALAVQGALVAVALQPDGRWKWWASNPPPVDGTLLTSPAWKALWHRAHTSGLRVRLYNRARRCTHDSLDGDVGEGES